MLLIVGVNANLRASIAIGLHASTREAPKAKNTSTLSLFSLHMVSMLVEYESERGIRYHKTHCNSFNT